uniref:Uncharacterized protein n=1 Tax=Acrobeloides nanus TaxID=290746 RepID=A0A914BVF1_9BILA
MPNFFNTRNYYKTFMESQAKSAVTKQTQTDSVEIKCGPSDTTDSVEIKCGPSDTVFVSEWDWQNCIFASSSPFKESLRSEFSRPLCISKFCNQKEHLVEEDFPPASSFPQPQFEHFPFHK